MKLAGLTRAPLVGLVLVGACVLQTETVPGAKGEPGTASIDTCPSGHAIRAVGADGSVVCEPIQKVPPSLSELPLAEIIDAVEIALGDRLLPTDCANAHAAVRTPSGWACTADMVTLGGIGPTLSFSIPRTALGGDNGTVLLTLHAYGANTVLAQTYVVHTGEWNTGTAVGSVGADGLYGSSSDPPTISVTANLAFPAVDNTPDDVELGVTVAFANMPSAFDYSYTVTRIGGGL